MKIQDRIKALKGVTGAHWDAPQNRLVVYYSEAVDAIKVRVANAIKEAGLIEAVESIILIKDVP